MTAWSIPGADGETILGDVHVPEGAPRGVVLVAHGFKGYKDYGMFPRLAGALAGAGFVVHRFNFSHSGMTNDVATFARPDLFERDTWNRQVHDVNAVRGAVADGTLAGGGLPVVLFGHSRGGVSVLLAAGRDDAPDLPAPAGVATAAAPDRCLSLAPEAAEQLRAEGRLPSPSSRTGQTLFVGRGFLDEQGDDPAGHDLPAVVARIACPVLIVHGTDDPTVPVAAADHLAAARGDGPTTVVKVDGANHVFDTSNPLDPAAPSSPALTVLIDALTRFVRAVSA